MSSKFNHVRTIINSARFFDMSDPEKHQILSRIENSGVSRDDLMAILSDSGWGILPNGRFLNTSRGVPRTAKVENPVAVGYGQQHVGPPSPRQHRNLDELSQVYQGGAGMNGPYQPQGLQVAPGVYTSNPNVFGGQRNTPAPPPNQIFE